MSIAVNLDGVIYPPEQARISVFDRQFLYGDGLYETMRTYEGKLFALPAHLQRLRHGAAQIAMPVPWTDAQLRMELEKVMEAAGNPESVLRMMITRGEGEFGLDPASAQQPRLVIIARPFNPLSPETRAAGIEVVVPRVRRNSPSALPGSVKSGNYLNQVLALAEGRSRGAFEVILLDDLGHVTEGSTSNVFWVKEGVLFTPSLRLCVLPGITRALVLKLAQRLGIPTRVGLFQGDALRAADEAFISSSLKELLPITRCDGVAVGSGLPGPLSQQLQAAFEAEASTGAEEVLDPDWLDEAAHELAEVSA
ncbi:MAG: aminotransferase class IV [Myxococcota bacterium]